MQIDQSPQQDPIGRCIYCDASGEFERLTREHIIPKMLAGNHTLPKASCDRCADITKKIEQYAGREIFQDVRLEHGFKMTKPPTHLPMIQEFTQDSPEDWPVRLVPVGKQAGMLFLIVPEPPKMFTGKAQGECNIGMWVHQVTSDERTAELKKSGGPTKIFRTLKAKCLAQFLAKIGLCYAVAACGYDGFDPEPIRSVIRGDHPDWNLLVGGTTPRMDEFPESSEKSTLHRVVVYSHDFGGVSFAVVQLQLFAYLSSPAYTIIIGELNQTGRKRLFGTGD